MVDMENGKSLFSSLDETKNAKIERLKQKENIANLEKYKQILFNLMCQVEELEHKNKMLEENNSCDQDNIFYLKSLIMDVCNSVAHYVDIDRLEKDLHTLKFMEDTKNFLEYICRRRVKGNDR